MPIDSLSDIPKALSDATTINGVNMGVPLLSTGLGALLAHAMKPVDTSYASALMRSGMKDDPIRRKPAARAILREFPDTSFTVQDSPPGSAGNAEVDVGRRHISYSRGSPVQGSALLHEAGHMVSNDSRFSRVATNVGHKMSPYQLMTAAALFGDQFAKDKGDRDMLLPSLVGGAGVAMRAPLILEELRATLHANRIAKTHNLGKTKGLLRALSTYVASPSLLAGAALAGGAAYGIDKLSSCKNDVVPTKLAGVGSPYPFQTGSNDWNQITGYNNQMQQPQAQQGGGGMGGVAGMMGMMALMGGMGGGFGNQAPEDNRTRGQMVTDAAKSTWDVTKQAPGWIGENLNPGTLVRDAVNPTGVWDGAKQMWNSKPGDGQFGAGALQAGLGTIAPAFMLNGARNGLNAARAAGPGAWNAAKGAISGAGKGIGISGFGAGNGLGIKALGQGLKTGIGMGIGKTVGALGLGTNLYDEAAGNTDYSGDGSFGDLAWGGMRAMGNNLSAAASGAQTAGPVGAIWGAGSHLATGIGRGIYDITKAKMDTKFSEDEQKKAITPEEVAAYRAKLGKKPVAPKQVTTPATPTPTSTPATPTGPGTKSP